MTAPALGERLAELIDEAQHSDYVFASPLGPFYGDAEAKFIPHFIYFGPQSSSESVKLSIIAGIGRHDLPAARGLTTFIEGLVRQPTLGNGLNLSFFPVVNVLGLLDGAEERDLFAESWLTSTEPEIRLVAQNALLRAYDGFILIVAGTDDVFTARVRTIKSPGSAGSGWTLFDSEDFAPWEVVFESVAPGSASSGPLTLVDDIPVAPFEIEIAVPSSCPPPELALALSVLLTRLITRYRAIHAHGQHL